MTAQDLTATQITEIFNRVAEDYRPFNINITTDSTKYLAAPANQQNAGDTYFISNGMVQPVVWLLSNSFTWGDNNPCFVFSALLTYNVKYISEAASHEAGHTLGLCHQASYDANCVKYRIIITVQGTGEIGWAPIMGVGYYKNFTFWNNGPNSLGCTNYQTDLELSFPVQ